MPQDDNVNGAERRKAVLLPNMVEFPAVSMKRYARELLSALRQVGANEWDFEELVCNRSREVERFLPGKMGEAWASRAGRFIKYPRMAARAVGDVYHVLDHSHANLVDSLPVERTILTCHDIIPYLAAKGLIPIPTGRLTRYTFPLVRIRAMKRCRAVIAISENTRNDLLEHAGLHPDQISVVYYGVNAAFCPLPETEATTRRNQIRRKYGIADDAPLLLHVGTATRYKNTPAILRALRNLSSDPALREVRLLRVGADFFEDEEALIDTLGVRERVVHAGRIFDDTLLADHYRAADVFVFPSLWEGFGWPPLEAMACGTPPVTSNVASLPEVVGDAGLTVPPADVDALTESVHRILTDASLRTALQQKCLARARQFTWEQCARGTLAVYRKTAMERRG